MLGEILALIPTESMTEIQEVFLPIKTSQTITKKTHTKMHTLLPLRLQQKLDQLHHPNLPSSLHTFLSLPDLLSTHALLIASGIAASSPFTLSRLLASAALSPSAASLRHAKSLFSSVPTPALPMFNTMIRAFSQSPDPVESVHFYKHLLRSRIVPDRLTFPFLLKSCSFLSHSPGLGRGVHCHVMKLGLDPDVYVVNNVIGMYSGLGDMCSAQVVFDEHYDVADVVSWTAMVTGYSNLGQVDRARWFFDRSVSRNLVTWNAMVAGYARARRKEEAWKLFEEMPERNEASWGSMVSGFSQCGLCKDAVAVFWKMVRGGVSLNEATLVSVISACAQLRALEQGERVYRYIKKHRIGLSLILATVLVDMYGKCGNISEAIRIFNTMPVKNVYSWNSMITGLANSGFGMQALTLFWKMRLAGIEPNDVTFIGLLSACSHSGLVDEGRWFFDVMTRVYGIRPSEEHYGCMVDLLARAGMIKDAVEFMDGMPVEPHPGLLGALAGACRTHGELEIGEEVAKRLIKLEPHHGGRYVLLANMYAAARRWDDMSLVRKMLKERRVVKVAGNSSVELQSVASRDCI